MELAFTGVIGAVFGSFLNVVAYRLPRKESLVRPASRCPSCSTPIRPYDNVPVLSWLILRGRCRNCSTPIPARYPLVEGTTAMLCAGAVLAHSSAVGIALSLVVVLLMIPVAIIDFEHRIIPNTLTALGAVLAVVLGSALDPSGEPTRLIAGAGAATVLLVAALAYPGGMGMGDVKLAGMIGLLLGESVIPAVLIALILGVVVGAVVIARKGVRAGRKTAVPFGPFLALGALICTFVGPGVIDWYSTTFIR